MPHDGHDGSDDARPYEVVRNDEGQYSIWTAGRLPPAGWSAVGQGGARAACLAYIERVWTDMRPLGLHRHP